ncbi:FtsX-like permease family protein [Candidatus Peregrinibacteria bacterium]|nr:FtsX-like permease family protein [Candidatus Peregrinibacteria bacterium]
MIKQISKMSMNALKENPVRSILTTLGIIIGTAIVIIVLSVGAGIKTLILDQITSLTPELLYVEIRVPSSGTRFEKESHTAQSLGAGVQITTMKIKDVEDVLKLQNIESGYGMAIGQSKFTHGSNEETAMIFAVGSEYKDVEGLKFSNGGFFTDREDKALEQVIVIGSTVKERLFGQNSNPIGQKVKVNKQSFEVIGVVEEMGTRYFLNMDEIVYIPIQTAQKKVLGINYIQAMALKMKDKNYMEVTVEQIEKLLRKNHNIKDPEKDDFVVRTLDDSMEIIDTVTNGISILLFLLAAISLVVGGVGIMNVMYVSVTERTHEIGLKKAVGAAPAAIKFQFIFEAVLISLLGGILGVLLGAGISWLVSFIANLVNFEWPFVISSFMIIFALSISVILGITFGYAPAQKAASLNPIDALKSA